MTDIELVDALRLCASDQCGFACNKCPMHADDLCRDHLILKAADRIAAMCTMRKEDDHAAPSRRGRWKDLPGGQTCCSECGQLIQYEDMVEEITDNGSGLLRFSLSLPYYCKRCGAKMDGGDADE